jgi:hypothetical protein
LSSFEFSLGNSFDLICVCRHGDKIDDFILWTHIIYAPICMSNPWNFERRRYKGGPETVRRMALVCSIWNLISVKHGCLSTCKTVLGTCSIFGFAARQLTSFHGFINSCTHWNHVGSFEWLLHLVWPPIGHFDNYHIQKPLYTTTGVSGKVAKFSENGGIPLARSQSPSYWRWYLFSGYFSMMTS